MTLHKNRMQRLVEEFHRHYNVNIEIRPVVPEQDRIDLRKRLMFEELSELCQAMESRDLNGTADGLADLLYVVFGTAIECGIDMEPIFEEVHFSNMSKLGADGKPIYDAGGKVLKGPSFQPPRIGALLLEQLNRRE